MRLMRFAPLVALILGLPLGLVAGCAPVAGDYRVHGAVSLPAEAIPGLGDPTRTAVNNVAHALNTPAALAGHPADAARAAAQYEYLAAELAFSPRGRSFNPVVGQALAEALGELRRAVGIAPQAEAQPVALALFAAARALDNGDAAAAEHFLDAPAFRGGGAATLRRLGSLPAFPRAGHAAQLAAAEMARDDAGNNYD